MHRRMTRERERVYQFTISVCIRILREQKIRLGENTATTSVVKRMSHERKATKANCRRKNARAANDEGCA